MESSTDGGIGSIVWVRRRNGSWWPGQIMDETELAEYNLTSPKTGTPVKLLGRDDASVDWYNVEKSKRVKAFRCGEFADCIKRAESAQGMPIKKREKYARREDAILHALELEKELLRKQGKLDVASDFPNKSSGSAKNEPGAFPEGFGNNSGKHGNVKLSLPSRIVDTDIKDEIPGCLTTGMKAKDGGKPISEDQIEATLQMRGMQDTGLKNASLKRALSPSAHLDGSGRPIATNKSQDLPINIPNVEITAHENGADKTEAAYRAKRSRCVYLPPDSSDSMDDKELPSSRIKMSSRFEDNDFHPHSVSSNEEDSSSGFVEDVESDSLGSNSSESDADSSETEPDMDREMVVFSDAAVPIGADQNGMEHPETPEEHVSSTSSEETDESTFSGDISDLYHDDPLLTNEAVSKWQLKGKRNIRYLTQNSIDRDYGKFSNGVSYGNSHRMRGSTSGRRAYGAGDTNMGRKYIGTKMFDLNYRGHSYSPRYESRDGNNFGCNMRDWADMAWENQHSFRGRWEDMGEYSHPLFAGREPFSGRTRSMLVDVDLRVQSSYQKDHVPFVSLMSKLDGAAITGHPIQVEAVEDGSSETLIPSHDYYSNEAVDHDGYTSLPPAWKTARRTNSRVPRPHLSPLLGVDEDLPFLDQGRGLSFRKTGGVSFGHKASPARKSFTRVSQPPADRKLPKKLPKKVSLQSNQKTRTLSSIGIQQNFVNTPMLAASNGPIDGLIKPETSRPTTVACIPVKLVFSRLLEKINRPPSISTSKLVLANRNEDGQPS